MGFNVRKAGGKISSTVRNPVKAINNPQVQRDLLNAGLLSGAGGSMGQAVGAFGTFGPRGGNSGGGAGGGGQYYDAYADPNSPESILDKGPKNVLGADPEKIKDASAWLGLEQARQKIEEQQAMDNASRQAGTGTAMAQNQLAMRGGLSSGARERVAKSGASGYNLARQGVARQGELSRLGLGTEAEKMNMEAARYNADMAFKQKLAKQDLENLKYQEQAKLFAAGKTADAMDAAAKKKTGLEKFGDNASDWWKKSVYGGR